jgi:2-polyprenyl-3-methyl-5-hydroxy-6-metoxy-1,4-benzoquinol methylase
MCYEIKYISVTHESINYNSNEDGKSNFLDKNISINICCAMLLNKNEAEVDIQKNAFHRLFYGKYIGGFAFEGYNLLPPLCILQTVYDNKAINVVYHNGKIYDPEYGIFTVSEYENKNVSVLSYVQIFIPEAYENTDWKPHVPTDIKTELEMDAELKAFWDSLSSIQQSKILNYIYPYSKPSSFKEKRTLSQPISPAKIQHIIDHIKSYMPIFNSQKSSWEELREFETVEAVDIFKKCGIKNGMTILDMGCGHGHYTFPASIATGIDGKIIAVDKDKKILKYVKNKAVEYNLKNIICIETNEKGLVEYKEKIDFIILYDVLHGLFNFTKADWGTTTKLEFIDTLVSLLKPNGILSLALYSEIENIKIPIKTKNGKETYITKPIPHDEVIKPYIKIVQSSKLKLYNIIDNGGVHFDDFHNPAKWRKYGEIKVSSLERRNIYNFIKL